MPIYEYRCPNGHTFEVIQSMSESPVERCEECGAPVERVFHPVAVHFRGSGFYSTDYAKQKAGASADSADGSGKAEAKKGKADSGGEAKSGSGSSGDSGTATATETSSD